MAEVSLNISPRAARGFPVKTVPCRLPVHQPQCRTWGAESNHGLVRLLVVYNMEAVSTSIHKRLMLTKPNGWQLLA